MNDQWGKNTISWYSSETVFYVDFRDIFKSKFEENI